MDTRIPHFDGQKDFLAFLRFLDNRKEFERYIKQLDTKIAAFVKAAKLYGNAKDIELLHEKAELWAKRAEHDYAEREGKLVAGEKALAQELQEKRAKLEEYERVVEVTLREGNHALKAREAACKAREDEVGKQEQVVARAEKAAQRKAETAVEAKQIADNMVRGMKAAFNVEKHN